MLKTIKIRFNTEHAGTDLLWRILIDEVEYLASEVKINVPTLTTTDVLTDGRVKHHISASYKKITWDEKILTVE